MDAPNVARASRAAGTRGKPESQGIFIPKFGYSAPSLAQQSGDTIRITRSLALKVLVLKSERLLADALVHATRRVLPEASIHLVSRVADAETYVSSQGPVDVLISGITTPDGDALDFLCRHAQRQTAFRRALIVTHRMELYVVSILRHIGIQGVVDSNVDGFDQFEEAIRTVCAGRHYWSERFVQRVLESMSPNCPCRSLTLTEQAVFSALGDGSEINGVADGLGMKLSTVRTICRSLYRKLKVQHRGAFVRAAIQYGIVRISPHGVVRTGFIGIDGTHRLTGFRRPSDKKRLGEGFPP